MWIFFQGMLDENLLGEKNQRLSYRLDHNFKVLEVKLLPSKQISIPHRDHSYTQIRMGMPILKRAAEIRDQNNVKKYRDLAKEESDVELLANRMTKMENSLKNIEDALKAIGDQLKNN